MNQADLVALIRDGVDGPAGRWADLGAGEGAFTLALAELLGPGAHITAVDRDAGAVRQLAQEMGKRLPRATVETKVADFTRPLDLSALDGIVMANSLHFVRDKGPVLDAVREMLRPGGRLVVVEYGTDRGNSWVPHPFSYPRWERMAAQAGFEKTHLLRTIPSRHLGSMYSAVSERRSRRPATAPALPPRGHAGRVHGATRARSSREGCRRSSARRPRG
ncbi:MAG: class I SAM-dependent methyltransferase [Candidatus Dormiibacterota bacterium]